MYFALATHAYKCVIPGTVSPTSWCGLTNILFNVYTKRMDQGDSLLG